MPEATAPEHDSVSGTLSEARPSIDGQELHGGPSDGHIGPQNDKERDR